MPYLNLDLDYFTNRKVVRLMGVLGTEHVALPIRLWCYVGKHHPETGELCGYSKEEIESAVGWNGEPQKMVNAMLKDGIGLLEEIPNGYLVHDWKEHAGHLRAFKKRAKTAAKKRWKAYATSIAKRKVTIAPTYPTIPTLPTNIEIDSTHLTPSDILGRWNLIPGVKVCKQAVGKLATRITDLCQKKDVTWWDTFFGEVVKSTFLTGRAKPREGDRPFQADLFWATGPDNLSKILSGKYDDSDMATHKREPIRHTRVAL